MTSKSKIVLATLVGAAVGAAAIHGLHAQTKPKAYTVTELETLDTKSAADVANRITKMQEGAGGRNFRTGGGKVTGMEGSPPPQRVAITEWENVDKARHSSSRRSGPISAPSGTRRSRPSAAMWWKYETDVYRHRVT